jgi:hypothetical protein
LGRSGILTAHVSAEPGVRKRRRSDDKRFSVMVPIIMTSKSDLP